MEEGPHPVPPSLRLTADTGSGNSLTDRSDILCSRSVTRHDVRSGSVKAAVETITTCSDAFAKR